MRCRQRGHPDPAYPGAPARANVIAERRIGTIRRELGRARLGAPSEWVEFGRTHGHDVPRRLVGRIGSTPRLWWHATGTGIWCSVNVTGTDEVHEEAQVLLLRLADDLDTGFVDLMRTYQQDVYSVALRTSCQPVDAEDLTSEAFLRAYRALRGYERERILTLRPRAWLLTIVLNTWRNWVRDMSRRPRQSPLDAHAEPPVGGLSVEETAERHETLDELSDLVGRLPDQQRVAVVLRHVVGVPIAEVADVLGCPQGTAKSHISRGLQRLRALYRPSPAADRVALEPMQCPGTTSTRTVTTAPSPTPGKEQL